jgi:hypothetical protein
MRPIVMLLLALLCLPMVHAVAIGVNRASLEFTDVLRGGYAEAVITVTTDSDTLITGEVQAAGEAAEWLNFSKEFNFSRDMPYELRVSVQPPIDAQIDNYQVNLSILTGALLQTGDGRLGTTTRASFRVPVSLAMTGTERVACTVGGVQVLDSEEGNPIQVRLSIHNRGNVRINPGVQIEVFDQLRSKSLGTRSTEFGERVLPTVTSEALRTFAFDLPPRQYWATVSVPECGYNGMLSFDVLEPGSIKDDGELLRISAPAWAETGDIIRIDAVFRNKGIRPVRATFKGTISLVDEEGAVQEIVKVIDSEAYTVDPDVTAEIPTFFNPLIGGQYKVTGTVYYNSKLTPERETLINVNGEPVASVGGYATYVLIGMAILILVLLIMIKKKRQQRTHHYAR